PGFKKKELRSSLRMSPLLIGVGLLEAIPEESILSLSDPEDSNNDGISGKPNYVVDIRTQGTALGRFGFKASHPTVEQQSSAAFFHDMGLTNPLFIEANLPFEVSQQELDRIVVYQVLAGVPKARYQSTDFIEKGRSIFFELGCHKCHTPTFVTGEHKYSELAGQTIHPFTDLLLHNMGPGLRDRRAEFSAKGSEWRTTPLWGLGFAKTLSEVKPRFLHDGRARNLKEAILWHGGEAKSAKDGFKALSKSDREFLISFLNSL
ncbi:MAG: thiol oxidoreductase, partial [Bdellovibrionales bacterium]|nr:thiol oxidoreductase [Bdellovibrionales bacterium]